MLGNALDDEVATVDGVAKEVADAWKLSFDSKYATGTADCISSDPSLVVVRDLKTGKSVPDFEQLMGYAACACYVYGGTIRDVRLEIWHMPRVAGTLDIHTEDVPAAEMQAFVDRVNGVHRDYLASLTTRATGEGCRYCPSRDYCPEGQGWAKANPPAWMTRVLS